MQTEATRRSLSASQKRMMHSNGSIQDHMRPMLKSIFNRSENQRGPKHGRGRVASPKTPQRGAEFQG
jgi:hypothetical protein